MTMMNWHQLRIVWATLILVLPPSAGNSRECALDRPFDLAFLLDSSASVGYIDFTKQTQFAADLVSLLQVGPTMVQVAMAVFGDTISSQFSLDKYDNTRSVVSVMRGTGYSGGDTYTHLALNFAREVIFADGNGHRDGVPKVVIVATDGQSSDRLETKREADKLRKEGFIVLAIAVGNYVDFNELNDIATFASRVYKVQTFGELHEFLPLLKKNVCFEGYVYLDPSVSQGQRRTMTGVISPGTRAICVEFYFATSGNESVPVDISIQDGGHYSPVHHIEANTGGLWESTHFACCLPHLKTPTNDTIQIDIAATSTDAGIPAIDNMNIRHSDMPCENGELVCYPRPPSQVPLEPGNAETCAADEDNTGLPSCNFNTGDKYSPETCGWELSSGWDVRQKRDGSGRYSVISTAADSGSHLVSNLTQNATSICIEIQFALGRGRSGLSGAFSIYLSDGDQKWMLGAAYDYQYSEQSVWKRNYFIECFADEKDRQIHIESKTKGLQIDYVHVRAASAVCGPPPQTTEGPPPPPAAASHSPRETSLNLSTTASTPTSTRNDTEGRDHQAAGKDGPWHRVPWKLALVVLGLILIVAGLFIALVCALVPRCCKRKSRVVPVRQPILLVQQQQQQQQ